MPRIVNRPKTRSQLLRETIKANNLDFDAAYLLILDSLNKAGIAPTGLLTPAPVLADLSPEMRVTLAAATTQLDAAVAIEEAKA